MKHLCIGFLWFVVFSWPLQDGTTVFVYLQNQQVVRWAWEQGKALWARTQKELAHSEALEKMRRQLLAP